MIKKCDNCGKEFDAQRDTAKYCDARCRKLAFHGQDKVSVPGCDDVYSGHYDLSEDGFIRRNKNWLDFPDKFREYIKKTVKEYIRVIKADITRADAIRVALAPKT